MKVVAAETKRMQFREFGIRMFSICSCCWRLLIDRLLSLWLPLPGVAVAVVVVGIRHVNCEIGYDISHQIMRSRSRSHTMCTHCLALVNGNQ